MPERRLRFSKFWLTIFLVKDGESSRSKLYKLGIEYDDDVLF
jgi:hypothetical protein